MRIYAEENQLWVVSYSNELQQVLCSNQSANHIQFEKEPGETIDHGQDMFNMPC